MNGFSVFMNGKKCINRLFPSKGNQVPRLTTQCALNGNGKFVPIGTFLSSYSTIYSDHGSRR